MVSPVPKHLRTNDEYAIIHPALLGHVRDLEVDASMGVRIPGSGRHRAKYAPGLATALVALAGSREIGDPMCGTGMLAWETGLPMALNDIDFGMRQFLDPLVEKDCVVTYAPAHRVTWTRDVCIFSPPYYPRTDRCVPNAHDDAKRGPIVGFRDCYHGDAPEFIGNPGGTDAVLKYREQMTEVYAHMVDVCERMIVVTKNWMRLGVELRLDLDTILMAQSVGWECVVKHGFVPAPSLWSRFNAARGVRQGRLGMVGVEDVMVFRRMRADA
jgi:hypothetical protein